MNPNIEKLKSKLEEELAMLEQELKSVGRINPDNPKDWEATPPEMNILENDEEEVADKIKGYEENNSVLNQLETRYNEVKRALGKIESGKGYGICEVGGEQIETNRLEANPAATTCTKHMRA